MDLPTMRARVRRDLRDSDAAQRRWSDDDLDRHVARAVRELSLAAPDEASATLTASAGSRDLDVSALADRVSIDAVEYPAGRWPRAFAAFSVWGDTLTLLVADAPAGGERAVVAWSRLHALTADASTLPAALEDVVAAGASGYAALEWASYATNRVNAGGDDTWRRYHEQARERLGAFARDLARHGRERRLRPRRLHLPGGEHAAGGRPAGR